ncbi:metallophosphoesterase [Alphaproteobacteria bacterium]|nr:metallophosphoesterase [Alphaproteobacteria bacterium]
MIKVKKIVRDLISLVILFVISYLIFIFPFDILSSWLGNPSKLHESLLATSLVFALCLYYFRSKSTNKIIKFFVYEGFGIGTVSFFIILPLIVISYFQILIDYQLVIIFFSIQIPAIIYGYMNSKKLKIKRLLIKSNLINKNINFVFISDVHIGSNHPSTLKKLVSKINSLDFNFLVIGGDLIDSSAFQISDLYELKKIEKPIFFVTGNHEYYIQNHKEHLQDLKTVGIKILENETLQLDGINLIGLSDNITNKSKIEYVEKLSKKDLFNLLIVHKPSIWKKVSNNANLMLSGHTHNGQIFPFNFVVKLQFPQNYGLYKNKNNLLYVSSGSATWGPKIRIGSNNEIIHIEFKN